MTDAPRSGVWPVMLTPFCSDGTVDMDGLDALTEWYLKCGVSGLFSVCLSGEMYDLSDEERLAIASRVVLRTNGRVPVFASGTFGGSISDQSDFICRMSDCGVNGVVLIVSQLASQEDDEAAWIANTDQILSATRDIRLGLYECPRPYHRILSADALAWCAGSGRFDFIKDTSCRTALIRDKVGVTKGTPLHFYDACAATLLFTLKNGGDGFCGIAANFYADLYVWLCEHFEDDPETAGALHRFLSVTDRAIGFGYPTSAKLYLKRAGLPIQDVCRASTAAFDERDLLILGDMEGLITEWRQRTYSPLQ